MMIASIYLDFVDIDTWIFFLCIFFLSADDALHGLGYAGGLRGYERRTFEWQDGASWCELARVVTSTN